MEKTTEKLNIENLIQNPEPPLVSVQICTYNRADFLPKALDSVLSQNYPNLEIIILDDASTDDTEKIISEYASKNSNIKYYRNEENLGITATRNKILSLTNGRYLAVLDSDDYWIDSNKISAQVNFLEENPEYALVGTFCNLVDKNGRTIKKIERQTDDSKIRQKILCQNQFMHSSVLYKKNSFNEYSNNYPTGQVEDYATWLELGKKYKFANLPIFTTNITEHSGNISKTKQNQNINELSKIITDYKKVYPRFYLAKLKNFFRKFI